MSDLTSKIAVAWGVLLLTAIVALDIYLIVVKVRAWRAAKFEKLKRRAIWNAAHMKYSMRVPGPEIDNPNTLKLVAALPTYASIKCDSLGEIVFRLNCGTPDLHYLAPCLTKDSLTEFWEWCLNRYGVALEASDSDRCHEWQVAEWLSDYVGGLASLNRGAGLPILIEMLQERSTAVFAAEGLMADECFISLELLMGRGIVSADLETSIEFYGGAKELLNAALPQGSEFYRSVDVAAHYAFSRLAGIGAALSVASAIEEVDAARDEHMVPISEGGCGEFIKHSLEQTGWIDETGRLLTVPLSRDKVIDSAFTAWRKDMDELAARPDRVWDNSPANDLFSDFTLVRETTAGTIDNSFEAFQEGYN